jgi:PAS domain S-box-containing protein
MKQKMISWEFFEGRYTVIGLSIIFGLFVCVLDAFLDYLIFYEGTFWNVLTAQATPFEIYIRLLILISFTIFGIIVSRVVTKRKHLEEALFATKSRMEHLLEAGPGVIYSCETSGDFAATFVSENVKAQLGYEPKEFTDDPHFWAGRIHSEDRQRVLAELPSLFEEGHHIHEYRFQHKDGTYRWMFDELRLVRDAEGNPSEIVGHWTDITDRKEAEEKLSQSEEGFRSMSMELAIGLSEVLEALRQISAGDPEVRISETSELELISKLKRVVNLTAMNIAGIVNLSHEFAIGLAEHFDVLHRVSKGDLTARVSGLSQVELLELLKEVTNQMIESVFKEMTERERAEKALKQYRDQLEIQVQERTVELRRTNEFLQEEIEDRMRKEEALRLSEERYRALFENNPIETIIVDLEGRVTGFNKAKEKAAKEKPGDRLPELGDRMYTEDYAGKHTVNMREELMDCLATGKLKDFPELQYNNRFLHINISPYSDGAIITSVDITKRKQAEEALRASEKKYSSLVENSLTGIYIDQDGKIVFANKRFAEIYRYAQGELLGMESWKLVHPEDRTLTDSIRAKRLVGDDAPSTYEARGLTKDGETIWINRRNSRIEYRGRSAILGNVVDITEGKLAAEKLLTYHQRLRSLASELSLAEERERRRIATEVHDHVGQNLAFAKIKLGDLLESVTSPDHKVTLDEISKIVDEAIQDTRSLISELGSPVLYELGFVPAIQWLTQQASKRHRITIGFEDDGQAKPLSEEVRVLLFQAIRELLANIVRHSRAQIAKVTIERIEDEVRISVRDDGIGFDPTDVDRSRYESGGFGLFSIRERLEPMGGKMNLTSELGQGTQVTLVGPLTSEG